MKRPRLLISLGVAVVIIGALAAAGIQSGRSLVLIENRSDTPLNLSVQSTHPGDFSWAGGLPAGKRIVRTARFTADGSVMAACRDTNGINRTTGGYVTPGWPHRVDVIAASCVALRVDADTIP
ncbi:hypothetical protein [Brevundimonas sp.]|uniref:hypothetical protein n=1 Tax=Brevundimonas sp. TaxID=1871086 RepID=UPI002FCC4DD2